MTVRTCVFECLWGCHAPECVSQVETCTWVSRALLHNLQANNDTGPGMLTQYYCSRRTVGVSHALASC